MSDDDWHYIYDDYIDYHPNLPPHYADPDKLPDRLPDRHDYHTDYRPVKSSGTNQTTLTPAGL